MQQHIQYIETQILCLEQKQALRGVDTARECAMLRDLLVLARRETQMLQQVLPCYIAPLSAAPRAHYVTTHHTLETTSVDVLDWLLRRFLIDTEVLCFALTTRAHHRQFYPVYMELVGPRRQSLPVPVVGTHTRHFWYTIAPSSKKGAVPLPLPRLVTNNHVEVEYNPLHALSIPPQRIPVRRSPPPPRSTDIDHNIDLCYRCNRPGHISRDCTTVPCKACKKCGHFESECPLLMRCRK